ncbi:Secreted protein [Nostoc sp. DSM 114161]|jgi:hypothetical protein|uniref:COP23 domain-containing protein n=1 Tax=Nostoc sp. DSM 114161 TaxID=3440143 RepID=UPI0040454F9F
MRLRLLAQMLSRVATASVTSALALAIAANTTDIQPSYAKDAKFFCDREGKIPVTKVRSSRGPETFMRWVIKDFMRSGFDPKTRCRAVSARLQRYYDNGQLFFTSRNNFNGYPVICIANSKGVPCTSDNILVTLKRGTNAQATLKQIHDFRRGVSSTAINLGGNNQHLFYFDGELYLDVKELVDSADSENNTQLPTTPSSSPVEPRF